MLKVAAVGAFSRTLRRYTSLNHLSSAARAVLQNQQQIQQMINDLNRVDFKNVQVMPLRFASTHSINYYDYDQEQASWVCQCQDDIVEQIEHSFKVCLHLISLQMSYSMNLCSDVITRDQSIRQMGRLVRTDPRIVSD